MLIYDEKKFWRDFYAFHNGFALSKKCVFIYESLVFFGVIIFIDEQLFVFWLNNKLLFFQKKFLLAI